MSNLDSDLKYVMKVYAGLFAVVLVGFLIYLSIVIPPRTAEDVRRDEAASYQRSCKQEAEWRIATRNHEIDVQIEMAKLKRGY